MAGKVTTTDGTAEPSPEDGGQTPPQEPEEEQPQVGLHREDTPAAKKSKVKVPEYDVAAVAEKLPDAERLQLFDNPARLEIKTQDGRNDITIDFKGNRFPKTTAKLIEAIEAHYVGLYDMDAIEKAKTALDEVS